MPACSPARSCAARRCYTGDTKAESHQPIPCSRGLGMRLSYAHSHQKKRVSQGPLLHQENLRGTKSYCGNRGKSEFVWERTHTHTHTSAFPVHARRRTERLCPLPCIAGQRACAESCQPTTGQKSAGRIVYIWRASGRCVCGPQATPLAQYLRSNVTQHIPPPCRKDRVQRRCSPGGLTPRAGKAAKRVRTGTSAAMRQRRSGSSIPPPPPLPCIPG